MVQALLSLYGVLSQMAVRNWPSQDWKRAWRCRWQIDSADQSGSQLVSRSKPQAMEFLNLLETNIHRLCPLADGKCSVDSKFKSVECFLFVYWCWSLGGSWWHMQLSTNWHVTLLYKREGFHTYNIKLQ